MHQYYRINLVMAPPNQLIELQLANIFEMEVKHRFSQLLELGLPLRGFAKLFTQDWEGDITMVMPATLAQVDISIEHFLPTSISAACMLG